MSPTAKTAFVLPKLTATVLISLKDDLSVGELNEITRALADLGRVVVDDDYENLQLIASVEEMVAQGHFAMEFSAWTRDGLELPEINADTSTWGPYGPLVLGLLMESWFEEITDFMIGYPSAIVTDEPMLQESEH